MLRFLTVRDFVIVESLELEFASGFTVLTGETGAGKSILLDALGLAAGAYWLARRHSGSGRFTFGSGKFGDLAAFASAILLGVTALAVAVESVQRIVTPVAVQYGDALLIAVIGLAVNLISAVILKYDHSHGHDHGHDHAEESHLHEDFNAMPASLMFTVNALRGVYLVDQGGVRKQTFSDIRVGLWYAITE